jgi:hypothetical protein
MMQAIPSLAEMCAIKIAQTQSEIPDGLTARALNLFVSAVWIKEKALTHISPKFGCELLQVARHFNVENSLLPKIMEVAREQKLTPIQRAWNLELQLIGIPRSYQADLQIKWNPFVSSIKTEHGEQIFINSQKLSERPECGTRHPLEIIDGIFIASNKRYFQLMNLVECSSKQLSYVRVVQVKKLDPAMRAILSLLPNLQAVFVRRLEIEGDNKIVHWDEVKYKNSGEAVDWTVMVPERASKKSVFSQQALIYLDRRFPRSLREAWLKSVLEVDNREEWVIPCIVKKLIHNYPNLKEAELSESTLQQLGSAIKEVSSPEIWELLRQKPNTFTDWINLLELEKRLFGKNPAQELQSSFHMHNLLRRAKEIDEDIVRKALDLVDGNDRDVLKNRLIQAIFPFQEFYRSNYKMNIFPDSLAEVVREGRYLWLLKDVPIYLIFEKLEHLPQALVLEDCGLEIAGLNLLSPGVIPHAATLCKLFPSVKSLVVPVNTKLNLLPDGYEVIVNSSGIYSSHCFPLALPLDKYINSLKDALCLAQRGNTIPLTLLLAVEPTYNISTDLAPEMVDIGIGALRAGCKLDPETMNSLREWLPDCPSDGKWVVLKNGNQSVRVDHRRFAVLSEKCAKESCLTFSCQYPSTLQQLAIWIQGSGTFNPTPQEVAELIVIAKELELPVFLNDIKNYAKKVAGWSSFYMYNDWYKAYLKDLSEEEVAEIHKAWAQAWHKEIFNFHYVRFDWTNQGISFEFLGYLCEESERGEFLRKHIKSIKGEDFTEEQKQTLYKLLPRALQNHFTHSVFKDESDEVLTGFLPEGMPLHDLGMVIDRSVTADEIESAAAAIPDDPDNQNFPLRKKLLEAALSRRDGDDKRPTE